jgi:hypothetical protein
MQVSNNWRKGRRPLARLPAREAHDKPGGRGVADIELMQRSMKRPGL